MAPPNPQRRTKTASALMMVLVLVSALSFVLVALVSYAGATGRTASKAELDLQARYAAEGAVSQVIYDLRRALLSVPVTRNYTVGRFTVSAQISNNDAQAPRTLKVLTSATGLGRTYTRSDILPQPVCPYDFGFSANSTVNLNSSVDIAGGGMYVRGSLNAWSNGTSIGGDLAMGGTLGGNRAVSVAGTTWQNITPAIFASIDPAPYQSAAQVILPGGTTFNGYTFTTPYRLVYVNGDATISGTFSGRGTIFVNGNVTISGTNYANANSYLVVIAVGNIGPDPGLTRTVGMYIAGGTMDNTSPPRMNNDRGFFVANSIDVARGLNITFDPIIKNDKQEAVNFKLPGFWP